MCEPLARAGLVQVLLAANITSIDVAGLALDVCVLSTCLDGLMHGFFPVRLSMCCTAPTSELAGIEAEQMLREAGVEVIMACGKPKVPSSHPSAPSSSVSNC